MEQLLTQLLRRIPKAGLKGDCGHGANRDKHCWHGSCNVLKMFSNGRMLLMNPAGFVLAVDPEEVEVRQ